MLRCEPSSGREAELMLAHATRLPSSWALNRLLGILRESCSADQGVAAGGRRRRLQVQQQQQQDGFGVEWRRRQEIALPVDTDSGPDADGVVIVGEEDTAANAKPGVGGVRSRRAMLWGLAIFEGLTNPKTATSTPSVALKERLNVHACTTLITLFGRCGQWTAARRVHDWMCSAGVTPNNFTYCALVSAYERGGQFSAGVAVLDDMYAAQCPPNDVVCATLLVAAARGGKAADIRRVLGAMKDAGVTPERVACTTTLALTARVEYVPMPGSGGQLRAAPALALFEQFLELGLQPTTTMYNILISACDKTGDWKRALGYLDELRTRDLKPDLVTYNSLLGALEREQQAEAAEQCLAALRAEGMKPQIRTYNALIAACDRTANLNRAMHWLDVLTAEAKHDPALKPDVVTFNALISCCDKAGRWDKALEMLDRMEEAEVAPNTITFSSAISACEKGGEWERALALFDKMPAANCEPNAITYNSLISACAAGQQWGTALEAFHRMRDAGLEADKMTYNPLLNALWAGGQYAMSCDLLRRALDDGLYDPPPFADTPAASSCDLHNMSAGAAHAALALWVAHLRHRYIAPPDGGGDGMLVAAPPPPMFHVITGWGKHSRRLGVSEVKIAVTRALELAGSPFKVAGTHNTGMLTASSAEVLPWLAAVGPEHLYVPDEEPVSSSSVAASRRQLLDEHNVLGPGELEAALGPDASPLHPPPLRRYPRMQPTSSAMARLQRDE